jgi:hypothetical protein
MKHSTSPAGGDWERPRQRHGDRPPDTNSPPVAPSVAAPVALPVALAVALDR